MKIAVTAPTGNIGRPLTDALLQGGAEVTLLARDASKVQDFVDRFNEVLDTIDQQTRFDQESLESGVLFGDPTVDILRSRMIRTMTRQFEGVDDSVDRLFDIGIRMRSGNRLEFNEEDFRERYAENPEICDLSTPFTITVPVFSRRFDIRRPER